MSNLALIEPQRVDFDTCQTCDWLDGLPVVGQPSAAGELAGAGNVGNGAIAVPAVAAATAPGVHAVAVTGIFGGFTHVTVTDPTGAITGQGVVGLPLAAGGITLTLTQGTTPFAVGDAFAIAVLPVPVDLTGLVFTLDARMSTVSATFAFRASSAPADGSTPTILAGGAAGTLAMRLLRAAMAYTPPGDYPYAILASDPATGLSVPAYHGIIHHAAIPALLGDGG